MVDRLVVNKITDTVSSYFHFHYNFAFLSDGHALNRDKIFADHKMLHWPAHDKQHWAEFLHMSSLKLITLNVRSRRTTLWLFYLNYVNSNALNLCVKFPTWQPFLNRNLFPEIDVGCCFTHKKNYKIETVEESSGPFGKKNSSKIFFFACLLLYSTLFCGTSEKVKPNCFRQQLTVIQSDTCEKQLGGREKITTTPVYCDSILVVKICTENEYYLSKKGLKTILVWFSFV